MNKNIEQAIKDSMDIVEVVQEFTKLTRKGVNYVGLCPLHRDRSVGSFAVDPRKNICSCWACGKTGLDPIAFLREKEGLSYEDALKWIAKLKGIDVEGNGIDITVQPRKEPPPLETLLLNKHLAYDSMKIRERNTLVRWLRSLNWDMVQAQRINEVLHRYAVGEYVTEHGEAFTAFWQADADGNLRSGKLMKYKPDGHRDKDRKPLFVHALYQYDKEKYKYDATLYGMHLLNKYPEATINIVESEKTALIMSIAYGMHAKSIWMATGGMQFLNRGILQPIIEQQRGIILYPDLDGIEQWRQRADLINYKHLTINTAALRKCWQQTDGKKADIADIVVRLIQTRNDGLQEFETPEECIKRRYPGITPLIDKLDLKCIK